MSFETPSQRMKNIKNEVQQRLANHEVKELANTKYVKLYRCSKPTTRIDSFDIILGPGCITVSGDIGEVLYTVGKGIEFLAKDGCSCYGLGKLEETYRRKKEVCDYFIADYLYELIYDHFGLEEIKSDDFPEELKHPSYFKEDNPEDLETAIDILYFDVVKPLYRNSGKLPKHLGQIEADEKKIAGIYYLLREVREHNYKPDEYELYSIIENSILCDLDECWWECSFTVKSWHVLFVAACAQYAAGRVLEQKKEAA